MSNSKPMSYDSLKSVIPHMNMDLRYKMSCQLPVIKNLDKLLPARFDTVEFDFYQTRVNDTTYRLGLVRQYPEGYKVPISHKEDNDEGGTGKDMTEHGFRVMLHRQAITPGDVDIGPGKLIYHDGRVNDGHRELLERFVQISETALALRLQQGDDLSNSAPIGALPGVCEERLLGHLLPYSAKSIREYLEYFRAALVPFHCRELNTPLPFVPMIQLTISSSNGTKIFRHAYNIKLEEAMKKLNTKLFGGRNGVHHIVSLILKQPAMVIRLPVDFRVRVEAVSIVGRPNLNLEALQSFVEESSYPLNMLKIIGSFRRPADYEHPRVQSAKMLTIENSRYGLEVMPILQSLQNQNVIFKCDSSSFSLKQQLILVENWINGDEEIGKSLSLELIGEASVGHRMMRIHSKFSGTRGSANGVVMPMRNGNNLQIKCLRLKHQIPLIYDAEWRMEMSVVPGAEDEEH